MCAPMGKGEISSHFRYAMIVSCECAKLMRLSEGDDEARLLASCDIWVFTLYTGFEDHLVQRWNSGRVSVVMASCPVDMGHVSMHVETYILPLQKVAPKGVPGQTQTVQNPRIPTHHFRWNSLPAYLCTSI